MIARLPKLKPKRIVTGGRIVRLTKERECSNCKAKMEVGQRAVMRRVIKNEKTNKTRQKDSILFSLIYLCEECKQIG